MITLWVQIIEILSLSNIFQSIQFTYTIILNKTTESSERKIRVNLKYQQASCIYIQNPFKKP